MLLAWAKLVTQRGRGIGYIAIDREIDTKRVGDSLFLDSLSYCFLSRLVSPCLFSPLCLRVWANVKNNIPSNFFLCPRVGLFFFFALVFGPLGRFVIFLVDFLRHLWEIFSGFFLWERTKTKRQVADKPSPRKVNTGQMHNPRNQVHVGVDMSR